MLPALPQTTVSVVPPEVQEQLAADVAALSNGAEIVAVASDAEAQNALELVKVVKTVSDKIEERRDSLVRPLNAQVTAINAYFKQVKLIPATIESNVKTVLMRWNKEQERIRAEAQRKADDEARRLREEQRKLDEENKRKADVLALEALGKVAAGDIDGAAELQRKADDISNTPPPIIVPVAPPIAPVEELKGFSSRKQYSAEITDKFALIRWAIAKEEWGLLDIDQKALNKLAQAKGEFFKADGTQLVCKEISSVRR